MFIELGIQRLKITIHGRKEELGKFWPIDFTWILGIIFRYTGESMCKYLGKNQLIIKRKLIKNGQCFKKN